MSNTGRQDFDQFAVIMYGVAETPRKPEFDLHPFRPIDTRPITLPPSLDQLVIPAPAKPPTDIDPKEVRRLAKALARAIEKASKANAEVADLRAQLRKLVGG